MSPPRSSNSPSRFVFSIVLIAALIGFGVYFDRTAAAQVSAANALAVLDHDLAREGWAAEVRQTAAWVITSRDNAGLPFVVIDQVRQRLFAFTGEGRLVGSTPILTGHGWHASAAPAGRFIATNARSTGEGVIVWANRRRALSLRGVSPAAPLREPPAVRGRERATAASLHVASEFYWQRLRAFRHHASVAYVLPDVLPVRRSFMMYAVAATPPAWSPA